MSSAGVISWTNDGGKPNPASVNIKGPQGEQGIKGDTGAKGDTGDTGATGAAAGFGIISATVDDNVGTPSVNVIQSGPNTALNIAFAFHNLKGDSGSGGGGLFRHDIVISYTDESINIIVSMYTSSAQEINNATFMNYITYFGGAYLCKGDLSGTALIYLSMYKNGIDPQKLDVEVCTQEFTGIESRTIPITDSDTVFLSDTVTQC